MKTNWLLIGVCLAHLNACTQSDTSDSANNATGTGEPTLARHVTGAEMFSTDQHFGYNEPCKLLDEGYVQAAFGVQKSDELTMTHTKRGCEFRWPEGTVVVGFASPRPFVSLDYADDNFDRLYRPDQLPALTKELGYPGDKPSIDGPEPEGTVSENPVINSPDYEHDTAAKGAARRPVQTNNVTTVPVSGVGDKAVWEPAKNTLHVLFNNNILNVQVQTQAKPTKRRQQAVELAGVVMTRYNEHDKD